MRKYQKIVIWVGIIISLICSIIMIYLFLIHKRPYIGVNYMLDTEAVGQYGDFMGGVIGTFLSVVLLFFTFSLQREDSDNNVQVYNNQQLNDEFFHLMDLYKEIVSQFRYIDLGDVGEYYEGKEALKKYTELLNEQFPLNLPLHLRRKKAISAFQVFYSNNNERFSIYFRTLYRMCQIIDNSKCSDLKKVEYIKILRAQFTNAELYFLRYNAMNDFGQKFREYINKYNLLKHCQFLGLMEFREWKEHLNSSNLSKADYTFLALKKKIKKIFCSIGGDIEGFPSSKRYAITLQSNCLLSKLEIIVMRDNTISPNLESIFSWMDVLSIEELERLLFAFVYEYIIISNFNRYNVRRNLRFDYNIISGTNDQDFITITVENKYGCPIVLSYNKN